MILLFHIQLFLKGVGDISKAKGPPFTESLLLYALCPMLYYFSRVIWI